MTLLPRTTFGRLAILLVAVVLIGQVAVFLVFRQDRATLLARHFGETRIAQLVAIHDALDDPAAHDRASVGRIGRLHGARIVPAAARMPMMGGRGGPGHGFGPGMMGAPEGGGWADAEPASSVPVLRAAVQGLERQLAERLGQETEIRIAQRFGLMWVRLDAGGERWWVGLPLPPPPAEQFPYRSLAWTAFIAALLVAAAYAFVRRLNRPLDELSRAVAAVGKGEQPPALPETGPREIAALAAGFNRMTENLRRHEQDRRMLLAGVSHDLRTPLARMRLGAEMLDGDEQTRAGMIADIEEMDRALGQLLEFARGEETATVELASLDDAVLPCVERHRHEGRRIAFERGRVAPSALRLQSLRRLVQNLVDNAFRHGSEAVEIVTRTEGAMAVLEVADRGPGIPPDQVERLKQPFTRLDTSRSGAAGTGLGLAIVDRIARNHGGTFELLPRPGGGTIARVCIPLRAPGAEPASPAA